MAMPRITLVTPSFNQGRFLKETLESVLDQAYPNLEYWVIDGGSSDESLEVLRHLERHLTGWVSEKDRGQAHALNKGFSRATGEIHAYLNSDDLLEPGALQRVAEAFNQGSRWVIGQVRNFSSQSQEIWRYEPETPGRFPFAWFDTNPIHQPGSFWAGELTRRFGPFNEELRYTFDYELFFKFRFLGDLQPTPLNETLAAFRLHESSKTVSEGHRFIAELESIRRRLMPCFTFRQRQAIYRHRRWMKADRRQIESLESSQLGKRTQALAELFESLWIYPPLAFQKRTLGCLRRIALSVSSPTIVSGP